MRNGQGPGAQRENAEMGTGDDEGRQNEVGRVKSRPATQQRASQMRAHTAGPIRCNVTLHGVPS